jgi:hypothetical protein
MEHPFFLDSIETSFMEHPFFLDSIETSFMEHPAPYLVGTGGYLTFSTFELAECWCFREIHKYIYVFFSIISVNSVNQFVRL